jgi:starch synthase (maltosyl-transferring)
VWRFYRGAGDLGGWDPDSAAAQMQASPLDFCRAMNPDGTAPRTVVWQFPVDLRREVMMPPGHFLLVRTGHPFRASITENDTAMAVEESLDRRCRRPLCPVPSAAGRRSSQTANIEAVRLRSRRLHPS